MLKKITLLLTLLALNLFSTSPALAASQSWHLEAEEFRHAFIVPVTVNGHKLRFFLDTGAPGSLNIAPAAARRIGLKPTGTSYTADMLGNKLKVTNYSVDRVRLGDSEFSNVAAITTPEEAPLPAGVDGILGKDLFKAGTLTLDFVTNQLIYQEGSALGGDANAFSYSDGHITVELQYDGVSFPAHLDTGNLAGFSLHQSLAEELALTQLPGKTIKAHIASGKTQLKLVQVPKPFCLNDVCFANRQTLIPGPANIAGIGARALQESRLTLDFVSRTYAITEKPSRQVTD